MVSLCTFTGIVTRGICAHAQRRVANRTSVKLVTSGSIALVNVHAVEPVGRQVVSRLGAIAVVRAIRVVAIGQESAHIDHGVALVHVEAAMFASGVAVGMIVPISQVPFLTLAIVRAINVFANGQAVAIVLVGCAFVLVDAANVARHVRRSPVAHESLHA